MKPQISQVTPVEKKEEGKYKIRDFSIRFAKQQAVERRKVKKKPFQQIKSI